MKKNILIGLALSGALFVGCGDKANEKPNAVEPTAPVATQTTPVAEIKTETPTEVVTPTTEPKAFDAVATFASKCAGCHGSKGEGKAIFPKLVGQTKIELAKKMHGYKDGTFGKDKKEMMVPNAKPLSDDEIEQIAEVISKF